MIEAHGLSVSFGDTCAVDDASLTLSSGELVVVAGRSGAGKSTLGRSLIGLEPRAQGSVRYDGRELVGTPENELRPLRGRELAMVWQDAAASFTPTMRIGAHFAEVGRAGKAPADLARAYPHELSGGMAQRAALELALALDPRVLIADEPTTGLDPAARELVLARLAEAVRRGAAVLVVTHDLDALAPLADRVIGMEAGRLGPAPERFAEPPRALRAAPPPADPLLEVGDLHFAYRPGHPVLRGASLTVGRGETLALTGPTGCGKTTLARCIVGLLEPDSGWVRFHSPPPGPQMVFQDPLASLNPRRRVGKAIGPRAAELLEAVGLRPAHAARFPHELSGGERQRVAIARALATDPALIVLDEPTSSLDRATEDQVLDLLAELRDDGGLALLLISHDHRVVERLADRACLLHEPEDRTCAKRSHQSHTAA